MDKLSHTFSNLRTDEKTHEVVHSVANNKTLTATAVLRGAIKNVLVEYYLRYGEWPENLDKMIETINKHGSTNALLSVHKKEKDGPK